MMDQIKHSVRRESGGDEPEIPPESDKGRQGCHADRYPSP
jgi:hypothetical protein